MAKENKDFPIKKEGKKFEITDKEADRWSGPDDFGIDPRVIAARKNKSDA